MPRRTYLLKICTLNLICPLLDSARKKCSPYTVTLSGFGIMSGSTLVRCACTGITLNSPRAIYSVPLAGFAESFAITPSLASLEPLSPARKMKTRNAIDFPATLRDLQSHPDFEPFGSNDDWVNEPERMGRCWEAAEHGADGSTHAEILGDWWEFLHRLRHTALGIALHHDRVSAEIERRADSIGAELEACEAWHAENGTLNEEIG